MHSKILLAILLSLPVLAVADDGGVVAPLAEDCNGVFTASPALLNLAVEPNLTTLVGSSKEYEDYFNSWQTKLGAFKARRDDEGHANESFFGFNLKFDREKFASAEAPINFILSDDGPFKFRLHTFNHNVKAKTEYVFDFSNASTEDLEKLLYVEKKQHFEQLKKANLANGGTENGFSLANSGPETKMAHDIRQILVNRSFYLTGTAAGSVIKAFTAARAKDQFQDAKIISESSDFNISRGYEYQGIRMLTVVGSNGLVDLDLVDLRNVQSRAAIENFIKMLKAANNPVAGQLLRYVMPIVIRHWPVENDNRTLSEKVEWNKVSQQTKTQLANWQYEADEQARLGFIRAAPVVPNPAVAVAPTVELTPAPAPVLPEVTPVTPDPHAILEAKVDAGLVDVGYGYNTVRMPTLRNKSDQVTIQILQRFLPNLFNSRATRVEAQAATNDLQVIIDQSAKDIRSNSRLQQLIRTESKEVGGLAKLWGRLGLEEAFRVAFSNEDNFWKSSQSLPEIYRNVYKRVADARVFATLQSADFRRPYNQKKTRMDKFQRNSNQVDGPLLLVENTNVLSNGQIVWNTLGDRAIVGADDLNSSAPFQWGVRPGEDLSSGVPVSAYSAAQPLHHFDTTPVVGAHKIAAAILVKALNLNRMVPTERQAAVVAAFVKRSVGLLTQPIGNMALAMHESNTPLDTQFVNELDNIWQILGLKSEVDQLVESGKLKSPIDGRYSLVQIWQMAHGS